MRNWAAPWVASLWGQVRSRVQDWERVGGNVEKGQGDLEKIEREGGQSISGRWERSEGPTLTSRQE